MCGSCSGSACGSAWLCALTHQSTAVTRYGAQADAEVAAHDKAKLTARESLKATYLQYFGSRDKVNDFLALEDELRKLEADGANAYDATVHAGEQAFGKNCMSEEASKVIRDAIEAKRKEMAAEMGKRSLTSADIRTARSKITKANPVRKSKTNQLKNRAGKIASGAYDKESIYKIVTFAKGMASIQRVLISLSAMHHTAA